jgi:hypothetical protein
MRRRRRRRRRRKRRILVAKNEYTSKFFINKQLYLRETFCVPPRREARKQETRGNQNH